MTDKVSFRQADIFATDFSDATVLTLYLSPSINLKLRPTILQMRPAPAWCPNGAALALHGPIVNDRIEAQGYDGTKDL